MIELREQLIFLLFIVILMLIAPLVLIAIDFWSGIRKARKRGDFNRKEDGQEHLAVFFLW